MEKVKLSWIQDLYFKGATTSNVVVPFDSHIIDPTKRKGANPTDVFLMSILGCASMSSVSLLKKMRIDFSDFSSEIEGVVGSSFDHPFYFTRFVIHYNIYGSEELNKERIQEAINKTHEKYCPMVYMASKIGPVSFSIALNDTVFYKSDNWEDIDRECPGSEICSEYYSKI